MKKELHVISTGRQSIDTLIEIVTEIHPFMDGFHVREKKLGAKQVFEIIERLAERGVPLSKIYVNDRIDVAVCSQVRGVQLTYESLPVDIVKKYFPNLRIGCSVHSLEEAIEKEEQGADFLIFGHIFETASKPGIAPRGVNRLSEICEAVTIPVLAIGGIRLDNIQKVMETKSSGVAVMSGILESRNPLETIQAYRKILNC
ncbi:thiazole tautomerase TenI [Calidifontibacillus erzurumensis]|uniref:Thiazole tautomerase TenI n=1 Tax=Calidifontibacillus erzurumensis TaxID=2741433 RepID=A0A8J8KAB2_9BACI|nr:thiazole tautomerase TenI [Calidifontibacillus erzurumensis]NSL50619.1 thiazole tautomerase TenI [Calidifontibacillus erzurumensis]